jgi:hypothetical protein
MVFHYNFWHILKRLYCLKNRTYFIVGLLLFFGLSSVLYANDAPKIHEMPTYKTTVPELLEYEFTWLSHFDDISWTSLTVEGEKHDGGWTGVDAAFNSRLTLNTTTGLMSGAIPSQSAVERYQVTVSGTSQGTPISQSTILYIFPISDIPELTHTSFNVDEGSTTTYNLDERRSRSTVSKFEIKTHPEYGTATILNKVLTYAHNGLPNTNTDTIKVIGIGENNAYSSPATITLNILEVNDAPVIYPAFYIIPSDASGFIDINPNIDMTDEETAADDLEATRYSESKGDPLSPYTLSPLADFYTLAIQVTDTIIIDSDQISSKKTPTTSVTNLYIIPKPTDTTALDTVFLNEDRPIDYTVTTFSAPDDIASPRYYIATGNINDTFSIHPTTGKISLATALDFSATTSFNLILIASDPTKIVSSLEDDNIYIRTLRLQINDVVDITNLKDKKSGLATITKSGVLIDDIRDKGLKIDVDAPNKILLIKSNFMDFASLTVGRIGASAPSSVVFQNSSASADSLSVENGTVDQKDSTLSFDYLELKSESSTYTFTSGFLSVSSTLNIDADSVFNFNGGTLTATMIIAPKGFTNTAGNLNVGNSNESASSASPVSPSGFLSPSGLLDDLIDDTSIIGDYEQVDNAFSNISFELNETSSTGKLNVSGTATLGGTLTVSAPKATSLLYNLNQAFDLIDADDITGSFHSVSLPELSSDKAWNTLSLYDTGTISVMDAKYATITPVTAYIYPNPVLKSTGEAQVYYNLLLNHSATLELYNMFGKKLYSKAYTHSTNGGKAGDNLVTIDPEIINKLSIGPYFILVHNGAATLAKGKFVVQ